MKIRKIECVILCCLCIVLVGCWDNVEINQRHIILEMAIDKAKQEEEQTDLQECSDNYEITYTLPDIGKLSGQDSLGQDVKTTIITKSPTVITSIDEIETKTQNTISFSHIKVLIVGEDLIKDRKLFKTAIDGLTRSMKINRNTLIFAVKGKAGNVTSINNPQNPVIGLYIMKYFDNNERSQSYTSPKTIGQMMKEIEDTGISTLPLISIGKNDEIQIQGGAVIKNYKLVEWLTKEEVRGKLFIDEEVKRVPLVIDYKGNLLTYTIENEESKITLSSKNKSEINIHIHVSGSVSEYISSDHKGMFSEKEQEEISELITSKIKNQVELAISKSRNIKIDFLNIGPQLYKTHSKLQLDEEKFNNFLSDNIPIQIITTIVIKNAGLLQ